jgi:hypothetical protein
MGGILMSDNTPPGSDVSVKAPSVTVLYIEILLILVAVSGVCLGLRSMAVGETVNSRMATVWSLTRDGTWYIDRPLDQARNPFEARTIDKVMINGRLLSSKPPVLPLLMTGEYIVLNRLFGWDLEDPEALQKLLQVMTLTLVIPSYAGILILFSMCLRWFIRPAWRRIPLLLALAFGTQLPGYSAEVNNHLPAAFTLLLSVYLALGMGLGHLSPKPWRFILFGLAGGLTFTFDLPMTVFVALSGLYLLLRFPREAVIFGGLGMLVPLGVHFGIMITVTGSPMPVQMDQNNFLFESSFWRNPGGIDGLSEPKGTYLFHLTIGRQGGFLLFPVLLTGVAGVAMALLRRDTPFRGAILAGALGFVLLTAYYVVRTNNYGGASYGFRWYLGAMSLVLLMSAPVVNRMNARWTWAIWTFLLAVSMYSAWECYQTPWGENLEWTSRYFFGPSY